MRLPLSNARRKSLGLLGAAALALLAVPAAAQEFPVRGKPIRVIVAFPPGAGVDAQARAVTPKLAELLGVPVVIENRPGGGTLLAAQEVLKSAPDGHTIFYSASSTMAQNPHTLLAATFDPMKDFTPISIGARGPLVLVVNSALGPKNVKDLVAWGKANPGKLSYASFGTGTSAHIFGQVFAKQTGLQMEHIPYKGGADLAADLIEGRVQMAFDAAPAAIQNSRSGKAQIIAVAAPQRSAFLPGVPTFAEQGIKDIDIVSFLGWFGPAGMKPEVVQKINAALAQSIAQPSVQEFYKQGAYTAESSTPEALARDVKQAYDAWGNLVKQAGITKQ
ncbi:tripartite tricarboxylate transporter substrate binding protein [Aquabacterium sp. J223]|uniref:Bug family tripartite tricarboxylate transporter substrate binding protein n=1 Tax=Aquabacterium sp. J223 TaxID=2898431 RepID=UPI0021AD745C|nr:tripartite tricarboxylate transporter substrate binding protein [Aquabacterium sp. J223]UUX97072.1 tripartite tricarboxylate transporter substrate binding protein [Aquabacterium sp. J223]